MLYEPIISREENNKVIGAKFCMTPIEIETILYALEKCSEDKDTRLWTKLMSKTMLELINKETKEE